MPQIQCGFGRAYNAQHSLIRLIEKWKKNVDNSGEFGTLVADLSRAFDCLLHELSIAKLDAYGFDRSSLKLIHTYVSNKKQRLKINGRYSSWSEVLFKVPLGSILGPLLFILSYAICFTFLKT